MTPTPKPIDPRARIVHIAVAARTMHSRIDTYPAYVLIACGDEYGESAAALEVCAPRETYYVYVTTAAAWTPRAGERTATAMPRDDAIARVRRAHEEDESSDPMSEDLWIEE